jgi:hypothetical protein
MRLTRNLHEISDDAVQASTVFFGLSQVFFADRIAFHRSSAVVVSPREVWVFTSRPSKGHTSSTLYLEVPRR